MEFHVPASWGDEKKTNNLCNSRSDSRWLSIIRGIDFTRSGDDRNSRIGENTATLDVLTPRLLSFPRSFFAYAHDRWETEKMRSTRQEGRQSLGHGRERVQQRRRDRCFPWMPAASFDAFYPESWIPRVPTARLAPSTAPVRSLVLSSRIVGARGTTSVVVAFYAGTIPL